MNRRYIPVLERSLLNKAYKICAFFNRQVFMNADCTQSFECLENIPDGSDSEGCFRECDDVDYQLIPIFNEGSLQTEFYCLPKAEGVCPGEC